MAKKRLTFALILVCSVLFGASVSVLGQTAASAQSAEERAKESDIRRLLNDMGAGKLGAQVIDQMFGTIQRSMEKQVPKEVWDQLVAEFKVEFSPEKLIELNVPIYAKHYTHEEIKQLIAFYESPIGRKVTDVTPLIAKEGYDVGAAHAQQVIQRIYEKLRSKGYNPATF
ncbi:MAG: DUF2059 domain-containing protein [Acidobacteriota bacterium]|nr:DUF2059 domain-containing protein [Acidobacteriota bacterium]